jgi:Zn-dependent protease with chaperone function
MDFFRSQDIARRNTLRLVVLFVLALMSLVAITNLLIMFAVGVFAEALDVPLLQRIDWQLFAWVSLGILGVVGFGSLYKVLSLAGGGARVAESLQGRLLLPSTQDLHEKRIINVVEEMAIAAGMPVPPVYILDEPAINAFAAGYTSNDAVIGITRGAIEQLSRDELQGVVAHEFSHILHGDMRLNIRLIGILHGIMVLGMMGYYLLRTTRYSRRSKNSGNMAVVGLGLMVIGFAGTFFGNLIKAAVSRQREFLADASAIQYTRNPHGIANALKRIGASSTGSVLENPGAAEISHALFSNGLRSSFSTLFATHPPLQQRIRRIDPQWDGRFDTGAAAVNNENGSANDAGVSSAQKTRGLAALAMAEALLAQAGNVAETDLAQAQQQLLEIPPALLQAAHEPFSARALVYLLLLDSRADVAAAQCEHLRREAAPQVFSLLEHLQAQGFTISPTWRMTLANLCVPALRQLSVEQYGVFRRNLLVLVREDARSSLWEWALQRVLLHQMDALFQPVSRLQHRSHQSLSQLAVECELLLHFLIRAGQHQGDESAVLVQALQMLDLSGTTRLDTEDLSINTVNAALDTLVHLKPLQKPAFLKACAFVIMADGEAQVSELELFRAIAAALDCPMPPLPRLPQEGLEHGSRSRGS